MATLADSLVSSSARKLSLRKRPDLSARRQRYQGRSYWVVKEPVGLNYFRFQEEEFAILQMLDGEVSLDGLKAQYEAEFPPQKITVEDIQQFLGTLHRSGLVIADVPGQGQRLHERRDERRRKELLGTLTNVLAIRFKGIDPERLLNRLYPWVWWAFARQFVMVVMAAGLAALLLVGVQFEEFQSRLPAFHQFFSLSNVFLLSVTLAVTKVLHEFGHGLACKHFGGECHEMGVMILVLTPCLYCNVSDSWMLPNKWHRAAIGAAGMYVEVVLATIATFIWWFSEPGLLNHLCLSTMFVCSVSTIIFNGNPLLKYDGYYILSDITEIPNLRQKATSLLSRTLGEVCLGLEQPDDPFMPEGRGKFFLPIYAVAAAVYRWVVVLSILLFLNKVFEPYRLQIIGQMIAAMALVSLVVAPLWKLGKFFYVPGRLAKVKKPRFYATLGVLAAIVAFVVWVPLPYSVLCSFEVQPRKASPVYVDVDGILEEVYVEPGDQVSPGTELALLSNPDVEFGLAELVRERNRYHVELETLERQRFDDPAADDQIPGRQRLLDGVKRQIAEKQAEIDALRLLSRASGTVLPPPNVSPPPEDEGQLPSWSGSPLDKRNLGCMLQKSTLFCQVGDPRQMEAMLVIDQADMLLVARNQPVELLLDELPFAPRESKIEDISHVDLKVSPKSLSNKAGGDLATTTDESGRERPQRPTYQARAPLEVEQVGLLRPGLRGRAKIHVAPQTLWQRAWRFMARTFNFDL